MRLAILSARAVADDGSYLAEREIFGATLLERQAAYCRALGATRFLLLIERLTAGVAAAVERLRNAGEDITVLRDSAVAADHLGDAEGIVVLRDGILFSEKLVPRLRAAPSASAQIVAYDQEFERRPTDQLIGEGVVSAGLAIYDGAGIRSALEEVAGWDLDLALPRAMRSRGTVAIVKIDDRDERLAVATARDAETWLVKNLPGRRTSRFAGPLLKVMTAWHIRPPWLHLTAHGFGLLAIGALALDVFVVGGLLALLSALLSPLCRPLADVTQHRFAEWRISRLRAGHLEFAWLAALAWPSGMQSALAAGVAALIIIDRRQRLLARHASRTGWPQGGGAILRVMAAITAGLIWRDLVLALAAAAAITLVSILWRQSGQLQACDAVKTG